MTFTDTTCRDFIIAGAGPVGLFLACELRLAGCSVLVLERTNGSASSIKALPFGLRGLTRPTLDSLDRRGLVAPLRARAARTDGAAAAHWRNQARRPAGHFAGIPFFHDSIDDQAWPYPPGSIETLAVTMQDLEEVLASRAADLGVEVRYGREVEALDGMADGVLVHTGGETLRAGWLIGCDGGRSTVRKQAGIAFAGTEPEFTGYSLRVRLDDPDILPPGRHHTGSGMYTFAAPDTLAMVEFDRGAHHRMEITRQHAEAVLRRVSEIDVRVASLDLAATWTDRAFVADRYWAGRVLLAGDAAHVHSPLGGQGLNLGLGDAMNLGWKLAAVAQGDAPPGLIDSYERERRPVAADVLDWSRAQVALMRPDAGTRALRDIVRALADTPGGATYLAGRVQAAALRYDLGFAHPLVGRSAPDLQLSDGTRLNEQLRDGGGVLLDLRRGEPLRSLDCRERYRLRCLSSDMGEALSVGALLVRPDGVIAWAGDAETDGCEVAAAVARWFGAASGSSRPVSRSAGCP